MKADFILHKFKDFRVEFPSKITPRLFAQSYPIKLLPILAQYLYHSILLKINEVNVLFSRRAAESIESPLSLIEQVAIVYFLV